MTTEQLVVTVKNFLSIGHVEDMHACLFVCLFVCLFENSSTKLTEMARFDVSAYLKCGAVLVELFVFSGRGFPRRLEDKGIRHL